jgi:cytochrome P450
VHDALVLPRIGRRTPEELRESIRRFEGRVALDEVLNRFPDWEVDGAGARLAPTSTVRGWESMPVVVG